MSMIRIVADYDNEDIESLAVTEAALLSQVFDIKSRKETLINKAVKESREEKTVKVKEEPEPELREEPELVEETSELGEAITAFRRAAGEFRDTLDNLVTLSGIKDKLESYDEVMNILDEILQKSTDFEEEKK